MPPVQEPTRQFNIRLPVALYQELWLEVGSTPGESMTSFVIKAIEQELALRKEIHA